MNQRVVFEAVPGFIAIRRCPAARVAFRNRHSYEKALRFDRRVKKLGLYNDLREIGSGRAAKNGFRMRCWGSCQKNAKRALAPKTRFTNAWRIASDYRRTPYISLR